MSRAALIVLAAVAAGASTNVRAESGAGAVSDLNGDGIADLVVGAPWSLRGAGEVFVLYGRSDSLPAGFELADLRPERGGDGHAGFVMRGEAGSLAGFAVAGRADYDGDGVDDLVVGAPGNDGHGVSDRPGSVFVVYGRRDPFPAGLDLASLRLAEGGDRRPGLVLIGAEPGDGAGASVSLRDYDGDGAPDIVVGAGCATDRCTADAEAWVVFGSAAARIGPELYLATLAGGSGDYRGVARIAGLRTAAAAGADSDGDGTSDDQDNCQRVSNPDQRDTNRDGLGNACDTDIDNDCDIDIYDEEEMKTRLGTDDPNADIDGDGLVNFRDLELLRDAQNDLPGPSGLPNACDCDGAAAGADFCSRGAEPGAGGGGGAEILLWLAAVLASGSRGRLRRA
jgi:hypothetical protein